MRFGCLAALATACARLLPSSAPDLSREAIRPADYGLTKEQWRLCTERIGHAGNEPTAEAEWCQKNIASIEAEERDRRERPERERRKAEERTHYAAQVEEWKRSPEIRNAVIVGPIRGVLPTRRFLPELKSA